MSTLTSFRAVSSFERKLIKVINVVVIVVAVQLTFVVSCGLITVSKESPAPWHVAIYKNTTHSGMSLICGGTLVNNRTVITAASCFYDSPDKSTGAGGHTKSTDHITDTSALVVVAGKTSRNYYATTGPATMLPSIGSTAAGIGQQETLVEAIQIPAVYFRAMVGDIAVVILRDAMRFGDFVQAICVDNSSAEGRLNEILAVDELRGQVASWNPSGRLSTLSVASIDYGKWIAGAPAAVRHATITDKILTVSDTICQDDRGSGLVSGKKTKDNKWRIYLRGPLVPMAHIPRGQCWRSIHVAFTNLLIYRDFVLQEHK